MIIKCPECGHQVSDRAKTCPSCGIEIAGKVTRCPDCGEIIFKDQAECPNCHCPINRDAVEEPLEKAVTTVVPPVTMQHQSWESNPAHQADTAS